MRTLVAVGTARLASMLATIRAAAPRSTSAGSRAAACFAGCFSSSFWSDALSAFGGFFSTFSTFSALGAFCGFVGAGSTGSVRGSASPLPPGSKSAKKSCQLSLTDSGSAR